MLLTEALLKLFSNSRMFVVLKNIKIIRNKKLINLDNYTLFFFLKVMFYGAVFHMTRKYFWQHSVAKNATCN